MLSGFFTEYPVVNSQGMVAGTDGGLWFTEPGSGNSANIGRLDPATGAVTTFSLSVSNSEPWGITSGPDGNIWFTELHGDKIGRINVTTHLITEFPIHAVFRQSLPTGITTGSDGNLWFTEQADNKIGKLNPVTGAVTEFSIPTTFSFPTSIVKGPDNALWFTEATGNNIGRITTAGSITEFPIPTSGSQPYDITVGPDNALWFTEQQGINLGRITTAGSLTEVPVPSNVSSGDQPTGITTGTDGNLWFTDTMANLVGKFNPTTGQFLEFTVPTVGSGPSEITTGPDGKLWFSENSVGNIGRLDFTAPLPNSLKVAAASAPFFSATVFGIDHGGAQGIAGGNFPASLAKGNLTTTNPGVPLTFTYCVSINLPLPKNLPFTWYNVPVTGDGTIYGVAVPNAGAISWLLTHLGPSATTPDQQSALQAAIWRTEYGTTFQLDGTDNATSGGPENSVIAPIYLNDLSQLAGNTAPVGNVLWISPGVNPDLSQSQGLVALQVITPPNAPVLAPQSDTGVSNSDRLTKDNGSTAAPLTFTVGGVSPANGFVRLFDVTNLGANLIGSATATGGTATITVSNAIGLSDGVHPITATAAVDSSSAQSALSLPTAVTIQTSVTIIGTNPSDGSGVAVLPNGQVAVSFSHPLAGLVDGGPALDPNRDPYAVFLVPRGPDLVFTGATGIDGGDLPLHANTIYHLNRDGTSTITITPLEPLSTDLYAISINLPFFTDLAGNTLTDPAGVVPGYRSFLLQPPSPTAEPLHVDRVTSYNGFLRIDNNATFQPDTIAITFNKPLFQGAALGNNVQLLNAGNGYSVVATVAAYSPATDTIYLTPIVPLQTGTTYLVRVDGSVSDDQGNSQPGQALGQPFYDTFSLFNGPAGPGSSPLRVAHANGIPQTMPGFNTLWGAPLGYASIAFTEPLNLSPTVFGRFSAMLDQQTQGSDGNAVMENIPLNARLAFNPNTNQLIIVPTQLTGNGLFVISLSNMQATTTGDPLLNDSGQQAGVTGPPFYSPFLLQVSGGSQAALHASGFAPPAPLSAAVVGTSPPARAAVTVAPTVATPIPLGPRPRRPAQDRPGPRIGNHWLET